MAAADHAWGLNRVRNAGLCAGPRKSGSLNAARRERHEALGGSHTIHPFGTILGDMRGGIRSLFCVFPEAAGPYNAFGSSKHNAPGC